MCFLTMFFILFLIMDPIGNLVCFERVLEGVPSEKRFRVLFREMIFVLLLMVLFNLTGPYILSLMEINRETVYLSSGVILFLTAMGILYPSQTSIRRNLSNETPFIIPLAVPLVAGPALLATIMLFTKISPDMACRFWAILTAWVLSFIVLFFRGIIIRFLGKNGVSAIEKVVAMVLILISIQRIGEGIDLIRQYSQTT